MLLQGSSRRAHLFLSLFVLGALTACSPETPAPANNGSPSAAAAAAGGIASPLDDATYASLSLDDRYRVVNKLMSSLYKGVPVGDFYDLDDASLATPAGTAVTLAALRQQLQTPLGDTARARFDRLIVGDEEYGSPDGQWVEARFDFDRNRPRQMPLARLHTYPLSRDSFSQWMAWHLANTILFSPAEEIDSADITDVQNLFRRLELSIMQRKSIREIVAVHQRTVENWRRFRSPEDNTREMMEIYLGIFDNDAEVPAASKACQDLYLTDEADGYKLARTDYPNVQPQLVLDQYVTSCAEFYDVIAGHPLLIPRVVSVLVDYFFAGKSTDERLALTQAISAANPQYFDEIFLSILFSRAYLLDTERAKSFEESFLATAERVRWEMPADTFKRMTQSRGGSARSNMAEMGWPSMSLKLGRVAAVPLDALSFANYHKAMREELLLDRYRWGEALHLSHPDIPSPKPVEPPAADADTREFAEYQLALSEYQQAVDALSDAERAAHAIRVQQYEKSMLGYRQVQDMTFRQLLDYLFLGVVQRRASDLERERLATYLHSEGHLDVAFGGPYVRERRMDDIALVVHDYLSRLPEAYYLQAIDN